MSSSKIFLSRLGQTLGPVSEVEFRELERTGRLFEYMWIWRSPENGWESLHAMPGAPEAGTAQALSPAALRPQPLPEQKAWAPPAKSRTLKSPLEAVLHDFHNLVSGGILTVSDQGCVLTCDGHEASPQFRENATLILNILDPATGATMNVKAQLTRVSRSQGQWSYQLNWENLPKMLQ